MVRRWVAAVVLLTVVLGGCGFFDVRPAPLGSRRGGTADLTSASSSGTVRQS